VDQIVCKVLNLGGWECLEPTGISGKKKNKNEAICPEYFRVMTMMVMMTDTIESRHVNFYL